MKAFLLRYLTPALIGLALGIVGAPWVQRPPSCPACPDLECPPNVSISMNPLDLNDIRRFKGDITQTTTVHGDVYLICENDTTGPIPRSRDIWPDTLTTE